MTKEFTIPASKIENRITKIQKRLREREIDGLLIVRSNPYKDGLVLIKDIFNDIISGPLV